MADTRRKALIALIVLSIIWSYNWIVMKQVLRYSGPFEFAAMRFVFGSAVMFVALRIRGVSMRPPPLLPIVLIGLAQTMAFQALVQWALVDGGAGKTALLAYTMPFWTILITSLILREHPSRRQIASLALALIGLFLVLEPWQGLGGATSAMLAIGGGVCWALGVVLTKRLLVGGKTGLLSMTAWQMLAGSAGLVLIALSVPERSIEWSGYFIGALIYNGLLSSGLAWLLWSYIVEQLPTSVAGLSSLVVPITGILLAWALLGETPSLIEAAGIVLIALALVAVTLRRRA